MRWEGGQGGRTDEKSFTAGDPAERFPSVPGLF